MRLALAAAVVGLTAVPAAGASRTASFTVGATVVTGCTVTLDASGRWGAIALGSTPGVGNHSVSGTLLSGGVAGIQLNCTPGATVNVTADGGDHAVSGQRRLAGPGSALIPYALYANGSAVAWTTQTVAVTFPAGVSARALPVTATATLTGAVAAGAYGDTVRITLSF